MPHGCPYRSARHTVPNSSGAISRTGCDVTSVRADFDTINTTFMFQWNSNGLPGGEIPNSSHARGRCHDHPGIRTESNRPNGTFMSQGRADWLAGFPAPNPRR